MPVPKGLKSTSTSEAIKVVGLIDLQKALRQLDEQLPRELRKVNLTVAQDIAAKARDRALAAGGVLAKAAPAIKAGAEQRSSFVRLVADATYPMVLGAEFGAGQNTMRLGRTPAGGVRQYVGYRQFKPWRGNGSDAGYALYPTIRDESDAIVAAYARRLDVLLAQAFPD